MCVCVCVCKLQMANVFLRNKITGIVTPFGGRITGTRKADKKKQEKETVGRRESGRNRKRD